MSKVHICYHFKFFAPDIFTYFSAMKGKPVLYLLPVGLSPEDTPPPLISEVLEDIDFFICERIRTTRRWLRSIDPAYNIDHRLFFEYDKHENAFPMEEIQNAWNAGKAGALTSEAGTPAVADPGFQVVEEAHRTGIRIQPLPGNNSLILGLMASGLDGNKFTYHGYFPVDPDELKSMFKKLHGAIHEGYTQIFIETPYRNQKTISSLIKILPADYKLSVSSGLLTPQSRSRTLSIRQWSKANTDYLHKVPAVFLIGK